MLRIYPLATYRRNQVNLGMTKSFNRCIQFAKGEWFGLIGSDDYYKPGAIDHVFQALHYLPPCLMVYARDGKAKILPPGTQTVRNMQLPSGSGNFWHGSIYEDLGEFDERATSHRMLKYWYRIATETRLQNHRRSLVFTGPGNNLMYDTWRQQAEFKKQLKLLTELNMVHRGEDVNDLDLVAYNFMEAIWNATLYILKTTSTKPDKFDIFDAYIDIVLGSTRYGHNKEMIDGLVKARNKK